MYSILLVDDDFFALEGMKSGVHFRELGFEEVYYCTSMASACKVLRELLLALLKKQRAGF